MGAAEREVVKLVDGVPLGGKLKGEGGGFAVHVGVLGAEGDAVVGDGVFDGGEGFGF